MTNEFEKACREEFGIPDGVALDGPKAKIARWACKAGMDRAKEVASPFQIADEVERAIQAEKERLFP